MLKGHVFSKQLFESKIFALFINTFLNQVNGISSNYEDGMPISFSGSNVTIGSGAVCIQGRFLEETTATTISAGTDNMYCKLVIEIDLDKTNTASDFQQGYYKIVKSATGYPTLTQTDIISNNSGIYQYELARFKTSSSGITDFEDKRTFLDLESIYTEIQTEYEGILNELEEELQEARDESLYTLKSDIYYPETGILKYESTGPGNENTLDLRYKLVFGIIDYVVSTNVAIFVYVPCSKKFKKNTSISFSSQITALSGRIYLADGTRIIPTAGSYEDLKEYVGFGSIYAREDDNYLMIRLAFPSEYFGNNLQLLKEKQIVRIDFTEIDLNYN